MDLTQDSPREGCVLVYLIYIKYVNLEVLQMTTTGDLHRSPIGGVSDCMCLIPQEYSEWTWLEYIPNICEPLLAISPHSFQVHGYRMLNGHTNYAYKVGI